MSKQEKLKSISNKVKIKRMKRQRSRIRKKIKKQSRGMLSLES